MASADYSKRITVLGSTGSVGCSTLDLVRRAREAEGEGAFPIEALTDPLVFFDARGRDGEGDQEKFETNLAIMMESCGRFIEPGTIDVFPSSQFCFGN